MKRRIEGLVLGLGLAAALLAAHPAGAEWASFRGDAALTGVATSSLPAALAPRWTFEAAAGFEGAAAIAAGRVYAGSLDGHLYALELATGKLLWKYAAGSPIKAPAAVRGDTVYVGDEKGIFHAVATKSGERRFTVTTGGEIFSGAAFAPGGKVLFGSYDGALYAVSEKDGALVWKVETDNYVHATPALVGNDLYFAGCDGFLRRVSVADGKETLKVRLGSNVAASTAIRDGRAYVGTFDNQVVAVDLGKGEVLWRYERVTRQFPYYSSAALPGSLVIVGGRDKALRALDPKTGAERWLYETTGRVEASPVVVGDRVFAASQGGTIFALEVASGREVWKFDAGGSVTASPAVGGGFLVIGTDDGVLYGFGERLSP